MQTEANTAEEELTLLQIVLTQTIEESAYLHGSTIRLHILIQLLSVMMYQQNV